jgi:hypothetical protein
MLEVVAVSLVILALLLVAGFALRLAFAVLRSDS